VSSIESPVAVPGQVRRDRVVDRASTWRPVQYLALAGGLLLGLQLYVWVRWAVHGVHGETAFRNHGSASWYGALVFQAAAVLLFVGVLGWLIHRCRKERRLTFDMKFCIAGLLTYWIDPFANFAQPAFFYSENLVNVNDWIGQVPLHQRTASMIEAPLMIAPTYAVGFLLLIIAINGVMRATRRRWPEISIARLLAVTALTGMLADALFELVPLLLHLWAYPGQPHALGILSGAARNPSAEYMVIGAFLFTPLAALRFFVDDRGQRLLERGLQRHRPALRPLLSLLATVGFFNLLLLGVSVIQDDLSTYADRYPSMPKALIGRVCDLPGHAGTAYGPCPGSPGYEIPIAHTAVGRSR
jgi:Spirocyclase AveC-like